MAVGAEPETLPLPLLSLLTLALAACDALRKGRIVYERTNTEERRAVL